nr:zinc ABC transporter substrate-binding protein [Anaerolineae bacterium]
MKKIICVLYVFFVLIGAGCTPSETSRHDAPEEIPEIPPVQLADGEKLIVAATTSILGDVVGQVGGNLINLTVLIDHGRDPHSYEVTATELAVVETAHLVFINGFDLEETLLDTVRSVASGPIVPVSARIDPLGNEEDPAGENAYGTEEGPESHHHAQDPHVWMDPANVIIWAETIADILSEADPAHKSDYRANAEHYIAELIALDSYIRSQVEQISPDQRVLITDHNNLAYFARAYDFTILGTIAASLSTTSEPSAADIASLVNLIQDNDVPALFIGESASGSLRQLAETIAQETGEPIAILTIYTGALDLPGTPGETYLSMMRYNADQLRTGLGEP